jgi:hypothetical protein
VIREKFRLLPFLSKLDFFEKICYNISRNWERSFLYAEDLKIYTELYE